VAGQVLAHRGTGVVGQWFTDEAVNPFGDTVFAGHEIVEGHVDRTLPVQWRPDRGPAR